MRSILTRAVVALAVVAGAVGLSARVASATTFVIVERDSKTVCAKGSTNDGSNVIVLRFVDSCLNAN